MLLSQDLPNICSSVNALCSVVNDFAWSGQRSLQLCNFAPMQVALPGICAGLGRACSPGLPRCHHQASAWAVDAAHLAVAGAGLLAAMPSALPEPGPALKPDEATASCPPDALP